VQKCTKPDKRGECAFCICLAIHIGMLTTF
jgi:hypothetical protein